MAVRTAIARRVLALLGVTTAIIGCDRGAPKASDTKVRPAAATPAASPAEAPFPPAANVAGLPEELRMMRFTPFTGDLDGMIKRRLIRIGVPYNRTFYFVDKGAQRGVAYELGKAFEEELNKRLKTTDATKVHVVFMPLPRDRLAAALAEGRIDVVAAQVTVRPELQARVDFSNPTRTNVSEVVVTGPGAPPIASVDDLSGQQVWVRRDSKYYDSLVALNGRLKAKGRPPVVIRDAPGNLEDEDLLEMVNAGLIPITVVDNYLAQFWKQILPNLTVHDAAALRTGGSLGLAMRHGSPQLAAALNTFLAKFGLGTAFGNIIEQRYLVSTKYVTDATSDAERKKFLTMAELFRKYSDEYDVDYLLMAAQGFQESQLNQKAKSAVGAIGVMQIMPATGAEQKVGDIRQLEPNIHAGVKYMRFMIDRYYKDEPMDDLNKALFSFASYNAGPGRVRQLRREAEARGLNPNVWFGNVEQIAAERVGQETVTYVANIYKYYVAYQLVVERRAQRVAASQALKTQALK
ncbi:transporter substrate-binding domain-containing protein [Phenylobacterium sp. LjRoot219]|uniref:transglycosylase SLT domain-containing protein n=1 Tax=Phenylobacterium sp. LjRoot219 TaxID=3342283 RepID=UPI003ED09B55